MVIIVRLATPFSSQRDKKRTCKWEGRLGRFQPVRTENKRYVQDVHYSRNDPGWWISSSLYRDSRYKKGSVFLLKPFHSSLLKQQYVKPWRLLEAPNESETIGAGCFSLCVIVFHIKLFHLLPPLIPPLLAWTPTSHNPSLHPQLPLH